jgi:hypothetical protein
VGKFHKKLIFNPNKQSMSTTQKNLTKNLNSFLERLSRNGIPLTNASELAAKFLKDLPEYKENYNQEIIASQIDCILLAQVI